MPTHNLADYLHAYRKKSADVARYGNITRLCTRCGQRRGLVGSTHGRMGKGFVCRSCNAPPVPA